jgi:hypothetical protein
MPEVMHKKVLAIEYPRPNETITSDSYTFQIAAMPGVQKVEVSINDAAWEPCRQAGGSFWYDWFCYGSGEYEMAARVQLANGQIHAAEHRFFTVELKKDGAQNGGERRTLSPRRAQQLLGRPDLHKHILSKLVVVVPNQPGVLCQLTELLSQAGVNVDSLLMETFGDVATFRFQLEKESGVRRLLESEGFHVVEDKVFCLELRNRPGELDRLARKLAELGVSIRYLYGTSHGQTTKVVFAVDRPEEAVAAVKEFGQTRIAA